MQYLCLENGLLHGVNFIDDPTALNTVGPLFVESNKPVIALSLWKDVTHDIHDTLLLFVLNR